MKNILLVLLIINLVNTVRAEDWKKDVQNELPLLGHRNWIVVVDSAYPWQVSPGVTTIEAAASQTEVVQYVIDQINASHHVRSTVYLDQELDYVPEDLAKGITAYRNNLQKILVQAQPVKLPHEQIIGKLDEAGKTFHILVLKTNMALPYTSVFFQLSCGYWSDESEKKLRSLIPSPPK